VAGEYSSRPAVETSRSAHRRARENPEEILVMRRMVRRTALFAILALLLPIALPSVASAQMREFTGKVDKISKKGKLIVDNRKGDKVSFEKIDTTEITGEKTEWSKIKKGDWVTVSWKMIDKPRKAYKINVMPPREEAGDDT
jgi:hypothetical protein